MHITRNTFGEHNLRCVTRAIIYLANLYSFISVLQDVCVSNTCNVFRKEFATPVPHTISSLLMELTPTVKKSNNCTTRFYRYSRFFICCCKTWTVFLVCVHQIIGSFSLHIVVWNINCFPFFYIIIGTITFVDPQSFQQFLIPFGTILIN